MRDVKSMEHREKRMEYGAWGTPFTHFYYSITPTFRPDACLLKATQFIAINPPAPNFLNTFFFIFFESDFSIS